VLNPVALGELSGGDQAMEHKILARFWKATQVDEAALGQALVAQNAAAVTSLAHRIKGAARLVGAREFAQACEALEVAARGTDWLRIEAAWLDFGSALERLEPVLQRRAHSQFSEIKVK